MPVLTVIVLLSGLLVIGLLVPTVIGEVHARVELPMLRWGAGLVVYVTLTQIGAALVERVWLDVTVTAINIGSAVNVAHLNARLAMHRADRRRRSPACTDGEGMMTATDADPDLDPGP